MPDLTMTRGARYAAIGLLFLTLVVGAGNLWATYDQVGAVRAASARAAHATATVTQLCEAGNEARAEQAGLWDYIIKISGPPPDAAARARLAEFERHLRQVFAPRNCHALTTRSTP